jgi:hypothetical protein
MKRRIFFARHFPGALEFNGVTLNQGRCSSLCRRHAQNCSAWRTADKADSHRCRRSLCSPKHKCLPTIFTKGGYTHRQANQLQSRSRNQETDYANQLWKRLDARGSRAQPLRIPATKKSPAAQMMNTRSAPALRNQGACSHSGEAT